MSTMEHRATFELAPEAASEARAVVNAELGPAVSTKVLEDATLLVSELVTNAVRHAPREGLPKIELRLKVDPGTGPCGGLGSRHGVRRGAQVAHGFGELGLGPLPGGPARGPMGDHHEGSQRSVVRDRRGCVMSMDPAERRAERRSVRKPRSPGPLAPWIWNPRWIPGFVLAQVAVLLVFAEKSPGSFEGVPGGFGALLSVATAIVCGPIAGALVSLVGGLVFVPLVTDFERGIPVLRLPLAHRVGRLGRDGGEAPASER